MTSWQRVAETAAIVGSVALCVIVAGPGGALENLLLPLFGSGTDPAVRLRDLAFGVPLAILLVPGLGLWAWSPRLRPSGAALTVVATLAVTIDLAVEDRLTPLAWVLLSALWLLALYQVVSLPRFAPAPRRSPALLLAVLAGVAPWTVQAARLLLADAGANGAPGDQVVVITFTLVIVLLLAMPLVLAPAFAQAGYAAAAGAIIYALASLRWPEPAAALPQVVALLAVATSVAYIDTVRQMSMRAFRRRAGAGEHEIDNGTTGDQPG